MDSRKKEITEYLSQSVNTFVQPMVYYLAKNRPADPPTAAMNWLKDYIGTKYNNLSIKKKRKE